MSVKLDKELEKGKQKMAQTLAKSTPVNEAKQLLLGESKEDARILRHLGSNSTLMQMETLTGKMKELEDHEVKWGKVFTVDQIEELAIKYRLRFLSSNLFIGKMDVEVTAKIKEFAKETTTGLDDHTLQTKFFILATPDAFKLQKIRVDKFALMKQTLAAIRESIKLDPVLFYKIDEDHFRMVHKWGNDFTNYRQLLGYKYQSLSTARTFNFITQLPFIALIAALIFPEEFVLNTLLASTLVVLVSAFVAWIRNMAYYEQGGDLSEKINIIREQFFTPNNWNTTNRLK